VEAMLSASNEDPMFSDCRVSSYGCYAAWWKRKALNSTIVVWDPAQSQSRSEFQASFPGSRILKCQLCNA
jgi:hypothetical protein